MLLFLPIAMQGNLPCQAIGLETFGAKEHVEAMASVHSAEDVIYSFVVWTADGGKFSYPFEEKPVLTHAGQNLLLTTTRETVKFSDGKVTKFTLEQTKVIPDGIEENQQEGEIKKQGNIISLSGFRPGSMVRVFDAAGRLAMSEQINENGECQLSLQRNASGVYVIATESITCKIMKK